MRNTPDATWHKQREREIIAHVQQLLNDSKFVLDTSAGRRNAAGLQKETKLSDKSVELKRQMTQVRPDRALEAQMPVGQILEATFGVNRWFIFRKIVGRVMVAVIPPWKEILKDENPDPMTPSETRRQLAALPPPLPGVPTTTILVSTSGFVPEAHELAERTSERIIILAEPNESGGWSIHGAAELSGILGMMDPEPQSAKSARIETAISLLSNDLATSSISAEKLAHVTQLPLQLVEDAVKSYAKRNRGLTSKRLDGRLLLFREGTTPTGKAVGGEGMSLLDRIKTLFARKGDNERKISFLSERRAALAQQRDTSHDEIFKLERRESDLRKEFKTNDSQIVRKRITSQLLQLRKEIDRRTQLLGVLNQQINIVSTHLHNLELLEQGKSAKLPDSEEIATDAAAAEEMLAQLQADSELADSVGTTAVSGMSGEEQALYEELLKESGGSSAATSSASTDEEADAGESLPSTPPVAEKPKTPQSEPG